MTRPLRTRFFFVLFAMFACASCASWIVSCASSSTNASSPAIDAAPLDSANEMGADAADASSRFDGNDDAGNDLDAGGPTLHLLFIGNSYTYVNDLPHVLERIAATAGVPPKIASEQVVVGAAAL